MENILIIITAYDIPEAESAAAGLADYRAYFFDPTLLDKIQDSKLRNAEFIDWDASPDFPALTLAAHARARALGRQLDADLGDLLPEGCTIEDWQHLNLFYFFLAHAWYAGLWQTMRGKLHNARPYIFLNDNPSNYYWPSFVPALLLMEQLKTWDIPFSGVSYGVRADESDVLLNLCEGEAKRYDLLTHLPTCFYDAPYFDAELLAAGKTSMNIVPKYWGVPLQAGTRVNLIRLADQQRLCGGRPALAAVGASLCERLDALLAAYIATPDYRARQVRHLSNLFQSQLASLYVLEQHFGRHRPGKMLLSDHDAGFHGPLITFAERHNIPVLMVPHSKTSDDTEFRYHGITMLTHPMQGTLPQNGARRRVLHFTLSYDEQFSFASAMPAPLRTIGLLLNGIALNGVLYTDFKDYLAGIARIAGWCRERNIALTIRCRPGQSLMALLHQTIGADPAAMRAALAGSLEDFARGCDLCLMYDAPTTAELEFLRRGIPIVNPAPKPLARSQAFTADPSVVPRLGIEDTLALLEELHGDENTLHDFRRQQFAAYVARFQPARALRRFL